MNEVRYVGTEKQRLNAGEVIIWSDKIYNNHYERVALLISQKLSHMTERKKS